MTWVRKLGVCRLVQGPGWPVGLPHGQVHIMFTMNVAASLAVSTEAPAPAVLRPPCLGAPVNCRPFRKGAVKFGFSCKLSAAHGYSHWLCAKESDQAGYSLWFWRRDVIALIEQEASALRPVPRTEWCLLPHTCPV